LIEIYLFGDLRRYISEPPPAPGTALHLPAENGGTLGGLLSRIGIDAEEVGNVFVNGRLLPRSVYPITLGYQLAADGPLDLESYLRQPVRSGDRLGVFPRKMSLVVV